MKMLLLAAVVVAAAMSVPAASPGSAAPARAIDPADFSSTVDNPYLPLSAFQALMYTGEEQDPDTGETIETRVEWQILPETKTVAGVTVLVLRDNAYEDGELIESTLDYFAQHKDGTVYYFGEDVDNYEDGVLVDHDGSWIAGEGANEPGVFMPADPAAGLTFDQERAPGIAEDHSTILEDGLSMTAPAGAFSGCIKTEDVNPLDAAAATENKWYCPGVGLIREQAPGEVLELASFTRASAPNAGGGADEGGGRTSLYVVIAGVLGVAVVAFGAVRIVSARRTRA